MGITFYYIEVEDFAEAVRHGVHKFEDFVRAHLFESAAVRHLHSLRVLNVVGVLQGVVSAQLHQRSVHEQPARPPLERTITPERRNLLEQRYEAVLHNILRSLPVFQVTLANSQHLRSQQLI